MYSSLYDSITKFGICCVAQAPLLILRIWRALWILSSNGTCCLAKKLCYANEQVIWLGAYHYIITYAGHRGLYWTLPYLLQQP